MPDINQQENTGAVSPNPVPVTQTQPIQTAVPNTPKSKNMIIVVILGVLFVFLVIGFAGFILLSRNKQEETTTTTTTVSTGDTTQTDNKSSVLSDKFIYIKDQNLYIADKDGSNSEKLTSFTKNEIEHFPGEIQLIDNDTLGFAREFRNTNGTFNKDVLYQLNLTTKQLTTIKELTDPIYILSQLTWADKNTYAYTTTPLGEGEENSPKEKIIYVSKGIEKEIVSFDYQSFGRGGMLGDASYLRFSPNKDKILQIDTAGRTGIDMTVYVYDLEGKLVDQIEDATFPLWKDNTTIVYKTTSDSKFSLYSEDTLQKKSTPLNTGELNKGRYSGEYNLKIANNKLLSWGFDAEDKVNGYPATGIINLYNFENNTFTYQLIVNGMYPIWLNKNEMIYAKTEACKEPQCQQIADTIEGQTGLTIEGYYVYNLETKKETIINLQKEDLQQGILTEGNPFLFW
jgi:hypothetical protein